MAAHRCSSCDSRVDLLGHISTAVGVIQDDLLKSVPRFLLLFPVKDLDGALGLIPNHGDGDAALLSLLSAAARTFLDECNRYGLRSAGDAALFCRGQGRVPVSFAKRAQPEIAAEARMRTRSTTLVGTRQRGKKRKALKELEGLESKFRDPNPERRRWFAARSRFSIAGSWGW